MKKMLSLFILATFTFSCPEALASTVPSATITHPEYPNVKVSQFLQLSVREIEKLSGEKMNLMAKISFRLLKSKMKRAMKKNPAITVDEFMNSHKKMKTWLLVVIIVLGAILLALLIFSLAYAGAF